MLPSGIVSDGGMTEYSVLSAVLLKNEVAYAVEKAVPSIIEKMIAPIQIMFLIRILAVITI